MSLQTQEINELILDFTSLPFRKEGARSTLYAAFDRSKGPVRMWLQHSPDGRKNWANIDESEVQIEEISGLHVQAWTENVFPEGTMLRMVAVCKGAQLINIKFLSA